MSDRYSRQEPAVRFRVRFGNAGAMLGSRLTIAINYGLASTYFQSMISQASVSVTNFTVSVLLLVFEANFK